MTQNAEDYLKLAQASRRSGNVDRGIIWLDHAMEVVAPQDHLMLAKIYGFYGQLKRDSGLPEDAIVYYQKSLSAYEATDLALRVAHVLRHIADIQRELRNYDDAGANYEKALSIYRSSENTIPMDLANMLRGNALYLEQVGEQVAAIELWKECREIYTAHHIQPGIEECNEHISQ